MSKRVLVMTGGTDIIRDILDPKHEDNPMEDLYNLTLPSKEKYARKHGYDFLSIRNFGCDTSNRLDGHLGKLRVYRAFRLLNEYDVVMWIDADSLITNPECGIEHFGINDSHCFYASWDWPWKNSFSTGNFIINRNQHAETLFRIFYDVSPHFPDEQRTLNAMCAQNTMGIRSQMNIMDHGFLGAIPSMEMYQNVGAWMDRQPPPYPWKKGEFLVHVTGITNRGRIAILTKYFGEYL